MILKLLIWGFTHHSRSTVSKKIIQSLKPTPDPAHSYVELHGLLWLIQRMVILSKLPEFPEKESEHELWNPWLRESHHGEAKSNTRGDVGRLRLPRRGHFCLLLRRDCSRGLPSLGSGLYWLALNVWLASMWLGWPRTHLHGCSG